MSRPASLRVTERRVFAWLLVLFAAGATAGATAGAAAGNGSREVGPFAITAHVKRTSDSARWMRTGNPFGTLKVREYSVAWRGEKLQLDGGVTRFWLVLELGDAPHPALLLSNGPALFLVADIDGRLEARALAPESGSSTLQWLDAVNGGPGKELSGFAPESLDTPPATRLAGGRWLYLHHRLLLDVHQLRTVQVEPWASEGRGEAVVEMNASNSPALALSPGRTRFVLYGEGRDYRRGGERFDLLLLIGLDDGRPEPLRLDPARTPFLSFEDINADWIAARFVWVVDADGRERLQLRSD
jgi:hypothetical protein